jgi:hypothetical protein
MLSVSCAIRNVDTQGILFFLGILLSEAELNETGQEKTGKLAWLQYKN